MKYTFFIIALIISFPLLSQDIINKNDGGILKVRVTEVGTYEVKYKLYPVKDNSPVFGLLKEKIKSLEFESGMIMTFDEMESIAAVYEGQKRNAVKLAFLSPLFGKLLLKYERSLNPNRSIETELGFIGVGTDVNSENAKGFMVNIGYKLINQPDYRIKGMKRTHLLRGGYFKPQILFNHYTYDNSDYYGAGFTKRDTNTAFAFMLNLGKQYIFQDSFLIDIHFGLGYGSSKHENGYNYGFIGGVSDFPLAVNAGIDIGFLLK